MKILQPTLALVLTLTTLQSFSQNPSIKGSTFFIEAGGNTFFYSLNYDRLLKVADKWRLAGRVGAMYLNTFTAQNRNIFAIPIEFSYLRGKQNNFFEVGLGFTAYYDRYSYNNPSIPIRDNEVKDLIPMAVLRIGYRHQKPDGGLFYKVGLTPLAGIVLDVRQGADNSSPERFAEPWGGAAIGWTLKN